MLLSFHNPWKSITEALTYEELNDFAILTGPNGAGKSQVLNAVETGAIRVDGCPEPGQQGQVRIFRLSDLVAQVEAPQALTNFRESWVQLAQQIRGMVESQPGLQGDPENFDNWLLQNIRQNRMASEGAIQELLDYSPKYLHQYSLQEIKEALPLIHAEVDPFQISISQVFGTYFLRRDDNEFQEYKASKGREHSPFIGDAEFLLRYGPPPWEVLNEALTSIGLNYAFDAPIEASETLPYSPRLRHREEGIDLLIEDLSAGERTLLAIALSLYTGSDRPTQYLQLPRVLLLDEPDASLHPSMVTGLLSVLQDVFISRHGVKILMTTHSPTTVALAPEESLYSMRRGTGQRLEKIGKDQAIAALAVGVPTLSVSIEDRRTVVVEERDDVAWYEMLYRLIQQGSSNPFSLQFVASGSGTSQTPENSGSSDEVRRLVTNLASNGNNRIYGIIDWDRKNQENDLIRVATERYSIENYILDPLLVGTFLLMNNIVSPEALGLPVGTRHFELGEAHAPAVINSVAAVLGLAVDPRKSVDYEMGFTALLPVAFTDIQGHTLESLYKEKFPQLNAYRKLPTQVLALAARDRPGFIPSSIRLLFERLSS